MSSQLHLQLAEIANVYNRLISILPHDNWDDVKSLNSTLREEVSKCAYSISRRVDSLRDLIDEQILKQNINLHDSNKAKIFFDEIQPKENEFSMLWLSASGLDEIDLNIDLDVIENKSKIEKNQITETNKENETVWIDTISFLISWSIRRSEDFLEEGGYNDSEIVVPNETYNQTIRLIKANFFNPDSWYENLQRINPILANPKKLPRDVRFRVSEIHSSLIIGNNLSSVILCRSVLEYCLAKQAKNKNITATHYNGKLKGLGDLVNEYANKYPEYEIDLRVVKRTGDNSIHTLITDNNVISLPKVGIGHAFKSWEALRTILQWLYA